MALTLVNTDPINETNVNWFADGERANAVNLNRPAQQVAQVVNAALTALDNGKVPYHSDTREPTATDDINAGYVIGTIWQNTVLGTVLICKDNTVGAAVWGSVGGGATGGPGNAVFYENDQIITSNYTLATGKNAMSTGPISINPGVNVTVPPGSVWKVI